MAVQGPFYSKIILSPEADFKSIRNMHAECQVLSNKMWIIIFSTFYMHIETCHLPKSAAGSSGCPGSFGVPIRKLFPPPLGLRQAWQASR